MPQRHQVMPQKHQPCHKDIGYAKKKSTMPHHEDINPPQRRGAKILML